MADKSLADKLKLKPGQQAALINAPAGYLDELTPLPEGVTISDKLEGQFDWVQVFVKDKNELSSIAPRLLAALKPVSLLWITFPKGSSKAQADLTRDKGWEAMRGMPLMWTNLVSVNSAWSAFSVRPLPPQAKYPMATSLEGKPMALPESPEEKSDSNKLPLLNMVGEKVALGPMRRDLIPLYQKWDTDFAVNRTTTHARPVTLEEETAAYDRYTQDPAHVFFTIYEKETGRPIGKTYLGDISRFTAEYGIVIGETDCQGQGYGTEVTRLVLDYAFTVLGLHNILLTVMEFNLAGIKAYEKAGFRMIGRRRQARWMNGKLWDVIYMDCLAAEFKSPLLADLFIADEPRE